MLWFYISAEQATARQSHYVQSPEPHHVLCDDQRQRIYCDGKMYRLRQMRDTLPVKYLKFSADDACISI